MRHLLGGTALTLALVLSGCSGDGSEPDPGAASDGPAAVPTYDGSLAPSAAVLPLVPQSAVSLQVTDYDRVRTELGQESLTTASPVSTQDAFYAQARQSLPVLGDGVLREVDDQLRDAFGISETDVGWEARFFDSDGQPAGYVLHLRETTDPAAFQRAVQAGVGPLAGAVVDAADRLVTRGAASDGSQSWAAVSGLDDLVGLPAIGFYVERGCVPRRSDPAGLADLDAYSVQFETVLVTARLGPDRLDLFDRLRLATSSDSFTGAFEGGVADPLTGRLGFRMISPPAATALATERRLAFAACSEDDPGATP